MASMDPLASGKDSLGIDDHNQRKEEDEELVSLQQI